MFTFEHFLILWDNFEYFLVILDLLSNLGNFRILVETLNFPMLGSQLHLWVCVDRAARHATAGYSGYSTGLLTASQSPASASFPPATPAPAPAPAPASVSAPPHTSAPAPAPAPAHWDHITLGRHQIRRMKKFGKNPTLVQIMTPYNFLYKAVCLRQGYVYQFNLD